MKMQISPTIRPRSMIRLLPLGIAVGVVLAVLPVASSQAHTKKATSATQSFGCRASSSNRVSFRNGYGRALRVRGVSCSYAVAQLRKAFRTRRVCNQSRHRRSCYTDYIYQVNMPTDGDSPMFALPGYRCNLYYSPRRSTCRRGTKGIVFRFWSTYVGNFKTLDRSGTRSK